MKRIIRQITLLAVILLATACSNDREHVLKIYNWADYLDETVLDDFVDWYKQETGEDVSIVYQLFDINEVMLSKIERGHEDFDLVCPSEYIIERMLRSDLLIPIDKDFGDTPNYIDSNMSPFIMGLLSKVDGHGKDARDYAIGYMWGTTGFLYNKEFVNAEDLRSWSALSNPDFAGKLFVKDAFRDVYSSLLFYIYQQDVHDGKISRDSLMFDASDESIALVEEYMKSIKDNVAGWEADFGKETMTKGKAWVNMTWSGDASWAIEEAEEVDVHLGYTVPEEGSNIWFDGWVIPKYARNVKAARYFINYLCRPDIAIRNMEEIGYVSAVGTPEILEEMEDPEAFEETVDASYFFGEDAREVHLNPVMYPDISIVHRSAMMHDSGDRTEALLEMWTRIKGDNATVFTFILIITTMAALAAYGISRRIRKYRKRSRR